MCYLLSLASKVGRWIFPTNPIKSIVTGPTRASPVFHTNHLMTTDDNHRRHHGNFANAEAEPIDNVQKYR